MGGMKLFAALLAIALLACSGCPHPGPGPGEPGKVIKCATGAVQACAPEALPAVNGCLAGAGDVVACILSLIQPAGCITYEVVSCLVRHEGAAAAAAARENPEDGVDVRRAARAKEFLARQGVTFLD